MGWEVAFTRGELKSKGKLKGKDNRAEVEGIASHLIAEMHGAKVGHPAIVVSPKQLINT